MGLYGHPHFLAARHPYTPSSVHPNSFYGAGFGSHSEDAKVRSFLEVEASHFLVQGAYGGH